MSSRSLFRCQHCQEPATAGARPRHCSITTTTCALLPLLLSVISFQSCISMVVDFVSPNVLQALSLRKCWCRATHRAAQWHIDTAIGTSTDESLSRNTNSVLRLETVARTQYEEISVVMQYCASDFFVDIIV